MCGLATIDRQMIVWRAIQGFIGGGMIPTAFATAYIDFPRRQAVITPMIGLVATLAPTIGPTVGGYLTECVFLALAVLHQHRARHRGHGRRAGAGRFRQAEFHAVRQFRLVGLLSMAGFLGALEYVLEEGARNNWFEDETSSCLGVVSAISAAVFFRVLPARAPIVDLRAYSDRNFALGFLFPSCSASGFTG